MHGTVPLKSGIHVKICTQSAGLESGTSLSVVGIHGRASAIVWSMLLLLMHVTAETPCCVKTSYRDPYSIFI